MKLKWNCFSDNFQFAKPFERKKSFLKGIFLFLGIFANYNINPKPHIL